MRVLLVVLGIGLSACASRAGRDPLAQTRPAESAPVVGPEFAMDRPIPGTGAAFKVNSSIACDADGTCLAVWVVEGDPGGFGVTVYGARLSANGTVLDVPPFPIATAYDYKRWPSVSFGKDSFLVAWEGDGSIYARRVAVDGSLLDETAIAVSISTDVDDQWAPRIASSGQDWLIAWNRRSGVYAARVTANGAVLDANAFVVSDSPTASGASVGYGPGGYVAVWRDSSDGGAIFGARITVAGAVLDPSGLELVRALQAFGPSVAFDGTNFLLAFTSSPSSSATGIYGIRLTPDLATLDASPFVLATGAYPSSGTSVAYDGANWLVAWGNGTAVAAGRVSAAGAPLDGSGIVVSSPTTGNGLPSVAFNGTDSVVAWPNVESTAGDSNVIAARVTTAGTVRDSGISVSESDNDQEAPAVATNENECLVVWVDDRNGDPDIYATRVSNGGVPLDADAIGVAVDSSSEQRSPAVASDGANFLVVWQDHPTEVGSANIVGALVAPDGSLLVTNILIAFSPGFWASAPAVGFGGGEWLVTYNVDNRLYGTRVRADGVVLDPDSFLVSSSETAGLSSVAFDGTNFVVAWGDSRYGTLARLVSTGGAPLGNADIQVSGGYGAFVVRGDTSTLIAYEMPFGNSFEIYASRLDRAGQVLDPTGIRVSPDSNHPQALSMAPVGADWLVAWDDDRNDRGAFDVLAQRVAADGALAGAQFAIASSSEPEHAPALASNAHLVLATYATVVGAERRVKGRVITLGCNGQSGPGCGSPGSGGAAGGAGAEDAGPVGGAAGASGADHDGPVAGTGGVAARGGGSGKGGTQGGTGGTLDGSSGSAEGGEPGLGGSSATGGGGGRSGAGGGSGRSSGSAAGHAGGAVAARTGGAPADASGCSCRVASSRRAGGFEVLTVLLVAGWYGRRRRQSRQ